MEADEEKAVALKGRKEAAAVKHELEEVQAHTAMLQSQLKAALMEVEAVKASKAQVVSQVNFCSAHYCCPFSTATGSQKLTLIVSFV
jgi:hypothetical protein